MSALVVRGRLPLAVATAALAVAAVVQAGTAGTTARPGLPPQVGAAGDESANNGVDQMAAKRGLVAPGAYGQAVTALSATTRTPALWSEVTTRPYNSDDTDYDAQPASNATGGAGYVTGRITGIAGDAAGYVYAGGANGGVFRRPPNSTTWTPISDQIPSLSTGYLTLASDGSLWLATGEFNFGGYSVGVGVFRLANPQTGTFSMDDRVGGSELESTMIRKLVFDSGTVWAATSRGIWKHSASGSFTSAWTRVFEPVDDTDLGVTKYSANLTDAIAVQPGTGGRVIVADIAYWAQTSYNGFYYSTDYGVHWVRANPGGAINPREIGPADMAFSNDGKKLYVVMESPALTSKQGHVNTALAGVYVSNSGSIAGPYSQIATSSKLANANSAMKQTEIGKGYQPGVQADYNRFITVDPNDANHVYLGLEEVYETRDGGSSWNTAGRYWNFGLGCWTLTASTCDGNVVHSDQHAATIVGNTLWVGNDGGLYSRSLAKGTTSWMNHNNETGLRALQYYSVGVGKVPGGVAVWGGLQDNGVSLLKPELSNMVSPEGGDGGDTLTDPNNGCRSVGEYVYLTLQMTTNCGFSPHGSVSGSVVNIAPNDPGAQFIAPVRADSTDSGYWVAGGEDVWANTKTWDSTSGDDWTKLYDLGAGHAATSLASQSHVVWTGWCGVCSARAFTAGIATNYGGTWHDLGDLTALGLPNRTVSAMTIDPSDPSGATVYAVFNGFSQPWAEGPGSGHGHVFVTHDGGAHWADVDGNLPDIPASDLVITPSGTRVLSTDLAVFVSPAGQDGAWTRLGTAGHDIPMAVITDLSVGPDGNLYAATYGRGIWRTPLPA
ncbi:MAG: hypothetical protein QOD07_2906 [Frankiaceae bacterium]|jgi:hypothetical protein|nr:hypothetical protein [Frankiaceae bacterium]